MAIQQGDSKAIKISFSAPSDLVAEAKEKAGTNFSAYLTSLMSNDLRKLSPEPLSSSVIVDLARTLIGELDANAVEAKLQGQNQPRILQAWLRQLAEEGQGIAESKPSGKDIARALRDQFNAQPSIAEQMQAKNKRRSTESA